MENTTLVNQHLPKSQGNTRKYKVDGALRVPPSNSKTYTQTDSALHLEGLGKMRNVYSLA